MLVAILQPHLDIVLAEGKSLSFTIGVHPSADVIFQHTVNAYSHQRLAVLQHWFASCFAQARSSTDIKDREQSQGLSCVK